MKKNHSHSEENESRDRRMIPIAWIISEPFAPCLLPRAIQRRPLVWTTAFTSATWTGSVKAAADK